MLSDRSVNVAMPPETVTVVVPAEGPFRLVERGGHLGGVVAGLEVAVLVFDVDDRLRAEGHAGRRCRRRLRADRQQTGRSPGLTTMLLDVSRGERPESS